MKFMRKKKGFTLMELIAIIVILSIIALISVPIIVGIVNMAQKASYKESIRNIFEATDVYLASNDFTKFPNEGIDVTNSVIKMKNKNFISGKILKNEKSKLELDRVSNNKFCGSGTIEDLRVVRGSCDLLDLTPPTVSLTSNLVTSSSIMIVALGEDLESGISGYQFSKDNGTNWTEKQTSNVYDFIGLINNTNYTFKVKVYNNNELTTISEELTVKTIDIPIPTYTINTTNWSTSKTVTIHYPIRESGYVYQYSVDGALTWQEVNSPAVIKDIVFNENGTLIARIFDGTNEISGAVFSITNIDIVNPSATITVVGDPFNNEGWAKANFNLNVVATDTESGIDNFKYCITNSLTCEPLTLVNDSFGYVTISAEGTTNKICVQSYDNVGNNSDVICSINYKLDKTPPVVGTININGTLGTNGWYTSNITISKTDGTDTLSGHESTVLSHTSITTETSSTTVTLTTTDNAGNISTTNQIVKIDKTNPEITFSMNGNNTYAKSRSTTVTVADPLSGILSTSLKYQWTTSTTTPSEASFTSTFTNGQNLTTPIGVTGDYYLWVSSKDNAGNTVTTRTNVFKLDNILPIITVSPLNITISLGDTYTDSGISASDNINGNITANIVKTGSVNTSQAGTYNLTYNVSDSSGNSATSITRTVTVTPITEYRYRTSSTSTSCSTCYDTCYSYTTGTASYSCSSGSLSGTSCISSYNVYSTFHATYVCSGGMWTWSSHYCSGNCNSPCSNGSSPNGYQSGSTCPSGSCTSGSTSCSNYWTGTCNTSSPATVTYVCPYGYYGGGASSSCSQSYSCNPYSCNCNTTTTWSNWSSWSTTPITATATRQVETRVITSL